MKQKIGIENLKIGKVIAEDIFFNGLKLVGKNTIVNDYMIKRLIECGITSLYIYDDKGEIKEEQFSEIHEQYTSVILEIKKVVEDLSVNEKINYETIQNISQSIIGQFKEVNSVIQCLNTIKDSHNYTYTHCINVAFYSMLLAKWLNLSEDEICEVTDAALLHDIGKTKVPLKILDKPARLTNEEFEEIKKHSMYGYKLISDHDDINLRVKEAVLEHHEREDGSGYPFGTKGRDIPVYAKIIGITDTFDAMTSSRVYKDKRTPFVAFKMYSTEGRRLYDQDILNVFLENISKNYIGSKVVLKDGAVGEIVYIPPKDTVCPIVKVNDRYINFSHEDIDSIKEVISFT
ncbi:MAG: HD-GYP domain-containing protein [Clostridiales bacterium]|nr:HD-GYP domain-containing protein [Clostridiales bacterium]